MKRIARIAAVTAASLMLMAATPDNQWARDARAVESIVDDNYAYRDRLPGGHFVLTDKLRQEAEHVTNERELIRFSERALLLLADHHAITSSSLADSWALVPTFADLWIEKRGSDVIIEQVRANSPASHAGIKAGDKLIGINGLPVADAVRSFWQDLGTTAGGERDAFALRVLAAGKRGQERHMIIQSAIGTSRPLVLPSLYTIPESTKPAVAVNANSQTAEIVINNSLGNPETITQFDRAMASLSRSKKLVIDLTDTPSGGNTTIARAIMGWFANRPSGYQIHSYPLEERQTGIGRQWIEQVLPRPGKRYNKPVTVKVSRWTGSMGEGLAIGMNALGSRVEGSAMAGLLGAVYDLPLPSGSLTLKIPSERLYTVSGLSREQFKPRSSRRSE